LPRRMMDFWRPERPVNVIVFALGGATDGTGGADHANYDYATGQNIGRSGRG
jgi:hypothetical protein